MQKKIETLVSQTSDSLRTLDDVRVFMSKYRSEPDSSFGLPSVEKVFSDFSGDCAGAAVAGKWALERIGRPASVYFLVSRDWGHCIAVSDDKKIMISNRDVVELADPADWESEVMRIFKNSYDDIIKAE